MTDTAGGGTSDDEVLRAIRDHYAPAVGTSDIVDQVSVTRQAIFERLKRLESEGYIESMKVGRARVWWLTPKGKRKISDSAG